MGEYAVTMHRGDIKHLRFWFKNSITGGIVKDEFDDVFFTVKRLYLATGFEFQKKLSAETITKDEDGYYHLTILPEDTNNLSFGRHDFDIEVKRGNVLKKTWAGTLTLEREVTYAINE